MRIEVDRTWDGRRARPEEVASLVLSDAGEHLRVEVDAPYHGDPRPEGPAGPKDGLWDHEVVELFVVGPPGPDGRRPYTEVELGPHGHHLVLQLRGVRHAIARALPLEYAAGIEGGRWWGEALVPRRLLPPDPTCVNAYAIHGVGDRRRYLAATPVPGDVPDFHRIEHFPPMVLP